MSWILVHVFVSVIKIVRMVNCKSMNSLINDPVALCDDIRDTAQDLNYVTPETILINCNDKLKCWFKFLLY